MVVICLRFSLMELLLRCKEASSRAYSIEDDKLNIHTALEVRKT